MHGHLKEYLVLNLYIIPYKKKEVVPVPALKAYVGSRGMVPLMFSLGDRC
jgi:hypothetical protein